MFHQHAHVLTGRWPQLPPMLTGLPRRQVTWSTTRGPLPSKPSRPSSTRTPGTTTFSLPRSTQRWAPRKCTLTPACSPEWQAARARAPERCVEGLPQVLRLDPATERRLLALLRERILPVAQKSLRVWKKGDTLHRTLLSVPACAGIWTPCGGDDGIVARVLPKHHAMQVSPGLLVPSRPRGPQRRVGGHKHHMPHAVLHRIAAHPSRRGRAAARAAACVLRAAAHGAGALQAGARLSCAAADRRAAYRQVVIALERCAHGPGAFCGSKCTGGSRCWLTSALRLPSLATQVRDPSWKGG